MSEPNPLSVLANLLRPVSTDVSKGNGKLCLSTVYLNKLNIAFNSEFGESTSQDLAASAYPLSVKKSLLKLDLQFLLDLVEGAVALKVSPDVLEDRESTVVNLRRFRNLKLLEIHKVDVKYIIGLQKLRSHIEDLRCMYSLDNLEDILDKCGGDFSHKYNWSELKRVNFSHNHIQDINSSFDSTPWLQTLDLSHNCISNLDFMNSLPNLKHLNLSYNKLEKVPRFRGQICKRLQVLLLNNNLIEDISGLCTLTGLYQLNLSQNCLMDHENLLSISQISSLYTLDLRGNPISFHSTHRTITCNFLNKNTTTLNFILDGVALKKAEKYLSGSRYPLSQGSLGSNGSFSSLNSLENSVQEKPRKVRNVTIQEGHAIKIVDARKKEDSITPSPRSCDRTHLDVKKKIEHLHQEYGDKWLSQKSGEIVQGLLKFPETPKLVTSTPTRLQASSPNLDVDFNKSENIDNPCQFVSAPEEASNREDTTNETFTSCTVKTDEDNNLDSSDIIFSSTREEPSSDPPSDMEDPDDEGIFVSGTTQGSDDLCVMISETHLSERDSATLKEKARWHINVVKSCQQGETPNEVKIEFDTLRSDRMARTYYMEDAEKFVKLMFEKMVKHKVPESRIQYECMNCSNMFSRIKKSVSVLVEEKVICPRCGANHVIEAE